MARLLQYGLFSHVIGLVVLMVLPPNTAGASYPIKTWPNGEHRQLGEVKVTGKPGRDYYMQVGPWTYWYMNGQMQKKGSFTGGTETGWWEYWYDTGVRKKQGAYTAEGKKTGPWQYWYENGLESQQGTYKDDLRDGSWAFYYNQAEMPLREEGNFLAGKKDGHWVYRYKNGRKEKEGSYIKGREDGLWTHWYDNGEIKIQGRDRNGLEVGEWSTVRCCVSWK